MGTVNQSQPPNDHESYKKIKHSQTLDYNVKLSCEYVTFTAACLRSTGVNGRIILRWIFRKWDVGYGLDGAGSG